MFSSRAGRRAASPPSHVDTPGPLLARQRSGFTKQAAEELVVKKKCCGRDLGRVLLKLEELQDEQIKQTLAPKEEASRSANEDRAQAMELLRDPRLLDRIVEDFALLRRRGPRRQTNSLGISAWCRGHLVIAAGDHRAIEFSGRQKLADEAVARVPADEQRVQYSAMTGAVSLSTWAKPI